MVQIKKETGIMWKYKVGNNANIDNFVCSWKTQLDNKFDTVSLLAIVAKQVWIGCECEFLNGLL